MQRAALAAGAVALLLFVGPSTRPLFAAARIWFVPWKVLEPREPPARSLFVLYWIPASPDEMKRSDLLTSRALAIYSSRCVAMHVIRVDDEARLERFGDAELPVAVLVDGEREIARVRGKGGRLRSADVEALVRMEFDAREISCEKELDDARELLARGDTSGAAAIYERIALRRCAFPRLAKEAQRALKRMR